jgi:hypothetical protein
MKLGNGAAKFSAPWGRGLKGASAFVCFIMAGLICIGITNPDLPPIAKLPLLVLPILLLAGTSVFMVLGYEVVSGALIIKRPGWSTRVPLSGLREAILNPDAMRGSIRIFGVGGLFVFNGLFWNKTLGRYRAYVTDFKRAVVLTLADRTIVVSPDAPERFIAQLREIFSLPS